MDFIETGGRVEYTVTCSEDLRPYAVWSLSGGSSSSAYIMGGSRTVTVTASDSPGNYVFTVKFYEDSSKDEFLGERSVPLKVVEPINIKITLKNTSKTDITFNGWLEVNGERVEDKTITIKADDTYEFEYEYITKDLRRDNTYRLNTNDDTAKLVVKGLTDYRHFYTEQNSYTVIEIVMVVIALVMVGFIVWVARKQVKNLGKPKGRR